MDAIAATIPRGGTYGRLLTVTPMRARSVGCLPVSLICVHRAERDRELCWAHAGNRAGLVGAARRGDVVVGERVAAAVERRGVHDPRVVVGHRAGVIAR